MPVATNIVLIDIFYGVDLSGTVAAIVLLTCVVVTMAPYARRLSDAVLLKTQPLLPSGTTLVALVLVLVGAIGFTWWVANHNNRAPTVIDGVWAVSAPAGIEAGTSEWRLVFFERNRAHLVVFRGGVESDARHHFEIDSAGNVRIWEHWLRKGSLIMQGRASNATQIELELTAPGGGRLVLMRVSEAR